MSDADNSGRSDTISLTEHETSAEFDLSDAALDALEEINTDKSRINVTYTRDGTTRLRSTQYVGAVSLPDGPTIRVQPKAAGTNFLRLLTYAHGVEATTIDRKTGAASGSSFVDSFAALFAAELETVLQRSPHQAYRRVDERESHLRGQLDLSRQLQRQGKHGTEFEVTYDELTTDTTANRALYQATRRLSRLVNDAELAQVLQRQRQQLRRWVSPRPVRVAQVAAIETTRLNAHYETPLRLAEQVLRSSYLEDFEADDSRTFGLLVDMNRVFERVVEQAAREALEQRPGWSVGTQSSIDPIVTGEDAAFEMRPDFVVRKGKAVRLIGDAKWKTNSISQNDVYQMTSYQLAHNVPGILVYPQQESLIETEFTLHAARDSLPLQVLELPTATPADSFDEFVSNLRRKLRKRFEELSDHCGHPPSLG